MYETSCGKFPTREICVHLLIFSHSPDQNVHRLKILRPGPTRENKRSFNFFLIEFKVELRGYAFSLHQQQNNLMACCYEGQICNNKQLGGV
jgi:hypothetical protein